MTPHLQNLVMSLHSCINTWLFISVEKQDVIEGDIIVDDELKRIVDMAAEDRENKHVRRRRDTIMYHQKRWKDAIVPYVIDPSVGKSLFYLLSEICYLLRVGLFYKVRRIF